MIGTPASRIRVRAAVLRPISSIASGGRADPDEAGRLHRAREAGVLGEEAVAGVHRLRPGRACGVEQLLDDQIALGRRLSSEREGLVGGRDVPRAAVGVRVDRDRPRPSSRSVRKTRIAISPRLATRTVEKLDIVAAYSPRG